MRLKPSETSVLVTGGARGIGRATVKLLLSRGYRVSVWDLDTRGLEELEKEFPQLATRQVDLSHRDQVQTAAADLQASGGVDVLINNAGVLVPGYFHQQDTAGHEFMMDINLRAAVFTSSLFIPEMYRKNRGHIINVSSAAGLLGVPGLAVYCASKYAILGFTEALRHEAANLGKRGVRFSSVHPNFLKDGLFAGARLQGLGAFIVPRVKNHDVIARAIVHSALERGRKMVYRPHSIRLAILLRGVLPYSPFLAFIRFLKVHKGMSTLSGSGTKLPPGKR